MAKQQNNKEDKGKIRVFLFELEGTNETLLESVRSITGALNQTFGNAPRVVRMIPASNDKSNGEIDQEIEILSDDDGLPEDDNKANKSSEKPKRSRRIKTPELITDLDPNTGTISLKAFVESKAPSDHTKKYLVIAFWLKEYRQIEEISDRHIYTCYRLLGWTTPNDIGQKLRDGKVQGYFVSGSSTGSYKLTHVGENRVQEMAKKS